LPQQYARCNEIIGGGRSRYSARGFFPKVLSLLCPAVHAAINFAVANPVSAHFQGERGCVRGFRACRTPGWASSAAAPQTVVQVPTSAGPLGRLKSPSGDRAGAAQLHLSLNHLKVSQTCAKRVLVAVDDSFLYGDDAVLISHKREMLHQRADEFRSL